MLIIAGHVEVDPLDGARVNTSERWESTEQLEAFRAVADAPDIGEIVADHVGLYDVTGERSPFD